MIPALDLDPKSDFLLSRSSGSRFGSSKKQNHKTNINVMNLGLDPYPESDFKPFGDPKGDPESRFRSSKKVES